MNTTQTPIMNLCIFTGNLGKAPEMSYTDKGTARTKFSIAVNQGDQQPPLWMNLIAWGKVGEAINDQLGKGDRVQVKGMLTSRTYTDKQNQLKTWWEVRVTEFKLIQQAKPASQPASVATESVSSFSDDDLDGHPF